MQLKTSSTVRRFVKCRIWNGGFSSERTFEIDRPGKDRILGIANVEYVRDLTGNSLPANVPPRNQPMDGLVQCRIIREITPSPGGVVIEVPSDELLEVAEQDLIELK